MAFTLAQVTELVVLLRAAARSEIMPRFRRLEAGDIREKSGPTDLVTEADIAAERVIEAGLHRLFPGCVVVGEEGAAEDPSRLGGIAGADLAFTVDPVDGTSNFAAGLPVFGTMAAAIVRGEIVAAVIHDPVGDDTAVALRGEGAWLEAPDGHRRDLRVAKAAPVSHMSGIIGWRGLPAGPREIACRNLLRVASNWDIRCSAHEYRTLAGGHVHFLLSNRLMPWDHAPGVLLHREAGGYAANFAGHPYTPASTTGGLLCAPDAESWRELRAALLEP